MKRILSLGLVLLLVLGLAGCKVDKGRVLYNLDIEKYVELGKYKGITIDTEGEEFKTLEKSFIEYDIAQNYFYKGTVKDGDTVNIDFVGHKDGVAFDGGSAQGYELKIGSGTFIPGFEEGLIGVEVGTTVSLNLTFPEDYGSADLAGEDVVFFVRVNYTDEKKQQKPEEYHSKLGYKKVDDYYKNVRERAIEEALANAVSKASKIKSYPKTDLKTVYDYYYKGHEAELKNSYGYTVEDYLKQVGKTAEEFEEMITEQQVKPFMDLQMLWYAILDREGMTITQEETDAKIKEIIAQNGDTSMTKADVLESFGELYIENIIVSEKVFDFLEKNAVIS